MGIVTVSPIRFRIKFCIVKTTRKSKQMFFKNIIYYRMVEPFELDLSALNTSLKAFSYKPCPRSENASFGWVSPYSLDNDLFVHSLQNYFLIMFCREEKIIPAAVIKEELTKKILQLEEAEGRTIYRKEKISLKEEIIIQLRQQAFSRKRLIHAYIDKKQKLLIVDTSSKKKAEEVCAYLRKTLNSLKIVLPATKLQTETAMTGWLRDKIPLPSFNIANNCEMLDPKQKMSSIKCKEQDLNSTEIINHLHSGKQISKIALSWQNKISFELHDDLSIKKIKFVNLIKDDAQGSKTPTPHEQLDIDFAIMTGEFSIFLEDLWSLFDGLVPLNEDPLGV